MCWQVDYCFEKEKKIIIFSIILYQIINNTLLIFLLSITLSTVTTSVHTVKTNHVVWSYTGLIIKRNKLIIYN